MKQPDCVKSDERAEFQVREIEPAAGVATRGILQPAGGRPVDGKIDRCIAYMSAHIDRPMQVATLARIADVSLSHFFAIFKRSTGCAPKDYFTRLRMDHAARLLGSGSASVKEVASALGYKDPFYFSRVFKSVNKVAPSKYRALRVNFSGETEDRAALASERG